MRHHFADIIIPTPLEQLFTYRVPEELDSHIQVGMRVVVSFGAKHFYTGIVSQLHNETPDYHPIKPIEKLLDEQPLVLPQQLELWNKLAAFYHIPIGNIFQAAVPQCFRLESKSKLHLTEGALLDNTIPPKTLCICSTLQQKPGQTLEQLNNAVGKGALSEIQRLITLGTIVVEEDLAPDFTPKKEDFIVPGDAYINNKNDIDTALKNCPSQRQLLYLFRDLYEKQNGTVLKQTLLQQSDNGSTILKKLVDKKILEIDQRVTNRLKTYSEEITEIKQLSEKQQQAFEQIKDQWKQKNIVLLHGVTSSGKTEIYIQLIKQCIATGKQALFLVPEIALTTQLAQRLYSVFGDQLGIYHSKFSNNERAEIWNHVLNDNRYKVILGTRSSLFLPFNKLGLIVIDEEHDSSYSQQNESPKYNARTVAFYLARIHKAKVLLGSATPSIESYCNTQLNKYGFVYLAERFNQVKMPDIEVVDMHAAYQQGKVKYYLSQQLQDAITQTLKQKEQVILFQNRRGFSPFTQCNVCGWVPKCKQCNVTLTYHKNIDRLKCHYCCSTQKTIT
ncbi:MAG: primosomal protein N', partial [Bacteroidales bacterium]|nr:primosomal protein N' [Bacteroidales bacterium]